MKTHEDLVSFFTDFCKIFYGKNAKDILDHVLTKQTVFGTGMGVCHFPLWGDYRTFSTVVVNDVVHLSEENNNGRAGKDWPGRIKNIHLPRGDISAVVTFFLDKGRALGRYFTWDYIKASIEELNLDFSVVDHAVPTSPGPITITYKETNGVPTYIININNEVTTFYLSDLSMSELHELLSKDELQQDEEIKTLPPMTSLELFDTVIEIVSQEGNNQLVYHAFNVLLGDSHTKSATNKKIDSTTSITMTRRKNDEIYLEMELTVLTSNGAHGHFFKEALNYDNAHSKTKVISTWSK